MSDDIHDRIRRDIEQHPVILYMKGTRSFPQCGFSARVVQILDRHCPHYETRNVLADPALREGIKQFSSWPTLPQLYVRGQLVGGCDIVQELEQSGELAALLAGAPVTGS